MNFEEWWESGGGNKYCSYEQRNMSNNAFDAGVEEERRRCAVETCVYCAGDKVDSMWEPMPIKRLGEWVHIFRNELLQEGKLGSNGIYEAPCYAGKIWAGSLPPKPIASSPGSGKMRHQLGYPKVFVSKTRCKFGHDTCDGINGDSLFLCRDCLEDSEWDKDAGERPSQPIASSPGLGTPIAVVSRISEMPIEE